MRGYYYYHYTNDEYKKDVKIALNDALELKVKSTILYSRFSDGLVLVLREWIFNGGRYRCKFGCSGSVQNMRVLDLLLCREDYYDLIGPAHIKRI